MTQQKTALDDKEIRGVSFSMLRVVVGGILIIVGSIFTSYLGLVKGQNSIDYKIEMIDSKVDQNNKFHELQLSTLDIEIKRLAVEIKDLNRRVDGIQK